MVTSLTPSQWILVCHKAPFWDHYFFPLNTVPIGEIIQKHGINYHIYADDCQLYASFNPRIHDNMQITLDKISICISEIREWMTVNYLKINDAKTEFFVAGSSYNMRHIQLNDITLEIGSSKIMPSTVIRNLGIYFDSTMSLTSHIDRLRRSILYHIKNIWRIRRFIDSDTCHHVVRSWSCHDLTFAMRFSLTCHPRT